MLQIPDQKLKELLIADGIINEEDFELVVRDAKRLERTVADVLLGRSIITESYYNSLLSKYYRVERANLAIRKIDESALKLLSEELARQKRAIVFNREPDGTLDVALEDPSDYTVIEFLSGHLKAKIKPFLASKDDLNKGFSYYGRKLAEDFTKIIQENIQETLKARIQGKEEKEAAVELPIVAIVDNLLSYAISLRSSDVHIEILEDEILIRYRIDGILHEIIRIPKEAYAAIVARIKLLAGLKLDEHRKPQDGRFRYKVGTDFVDIRVAVMPVFYGEKVEMRLLTAAARPLSLEELGMFPDNLKILNINLKKTYGMILVTGPTGAGKTTTLYSILNILNRPEVNIVTIEDPVEYEIRYVNQTQVNPVAGLTFATGLRAIVRQDPNIIMVGEIRDEETAEIAVHSALTGHLVLSSLHTNDAPTAIPRLIDMKIVPFLVAAVVNSVVAQRLARRICLECISSAPVNKELIDSIKKQIEELKLKIEFRIPKAIFKGKGCQACNFTGYKGRIGIFEILDVNEEMRKYIVSPAFTLDGLRELAKKTGMIMMLEDGLRKVERGLTTIEEVLRVIRE
jgi:type IV pilus assembly protein PilB